MQRRFSLRWIELARDDVGGQVRAKIREKERHPVDDDEERRIVRLELVVKERDDTETHADHPVAEDLHVLAAKLVDEAGAEEIAWQHDKNDDECPQHRRFQASRADLDDGCDVAVEERVGVEHDVEDEPVPGCTEQVPAIALHCFTDVHGRSTLLSRRVNLLEVLAFMHHHPEVQGHDRHDSTEAQGETPCEIQGQLAVGQEDHRR
mmetsp:Transcript_87750/g.246569  ORF Transcript_87750/g.246569 Transcript_87750/m.246569 type:complete len:206 (+) Transcript_87750:350-967(+)